MAFRVLLYISGAFLLLMDIGPDFGVRCMESTTTTISLEHEPIVIIEDQEKTKKSESLRYTKNAPAKSAIFKKETNLNSSTSKKGTTETEKTFWIPEGELGYILSNATATKRLLNLSRDTYEQNSQPKDNIPLKAVMRSLKEKIKEAEEEKEKKLLLSKKSDLVINENDENDKKENVAKVDIDNKDAPEKISGNDKESLTKEIMSSGKEDDDNKPEKVGVTANEAENIEQTDNETKHDSEKVGFADKKNKMNSQNTTVSGKVVTEASADKKTIIAEEPVITQTPVIKITEDNPSKKSIPEEPLITITGDLKESMTEEPTVTHTHVVTKLLPEEPHITQTPAAKKSLTEEPIITQNLPEEPVISQTPVVKISPEETVITKTGTKKSLPEEQVISQAPVIKISPEEPTITQTLGTKKSLPEELIITQTPATKKSLPEEPIITQTPAVKKTIDDEPVITLVDEESELDKTNAHIKNTKPKSSIDRKIKKQTTKKSEPADLDDLNGTKKQSIGIDINEGTLPGFVVLNNRKSSRKTDIQAALESTAVTDDTMQHKGGQLPMLDSPKLESLSKSINGYPADFLESVNPIESSNVHKAIHDDEDSTIRADIPTTLARQNKSGSSGSNSSQITSAQQDLPTKPNTTASSNSSATTTDSMADSDFSESLTANMANLMEFNDDNKSSSTQPNFSPLQRMNVEAKNATNKTEDGETSSANNSTKEEDKDTVDKSSPVFDVPSKKPLMTTNGSTRDQVATASKSKVIEDDVETTDFVRNVSLTPTNKVISMMGPTAFSFNEISQQNDDVAAAVPTATFQLKSTISNITTQNGTIKTDVNVSSNNTNASLSNSSSAEVQEESPLIKSPTSSMLSTATPTNTDQESNSNTTTMSTDMASINADEETIAQNDSASLVGFRMPRLRFPTSSRSTSPKSENSSRDVNDFLDAKNKTDQVAEPFATVSTEDAKNKIEANTASPAMNPTENVSADNIDDKVTTSELKHEITKLDKTVNATSTEENNELNRFDIKKLFSPKVVLNNNTVPNKITEVKSHAPDTPIINDVIQNKTETVSNTTTVATSKTPLRPTFAVVNPIVVEPAPANPIAADLSDEDSQPIVSPEEEIPSESTSLVDDTAAKVPAFGGAGLSSHMPIQGPSAFTPINAHDITENYLPSLQKYMNLEKVGSIPAQETLGAQISKYPYFGATLDVVNSNADMLTNTNILTARTSILPNTLIPKRPAVDPSLKKSKTPKGVQPKKNTPNPKPKKLSAVSSSTIKELTQSLKRKILDVWPYPKYIKSPADAMLDQGLINRAKMHLSSGKRLENLFKRAVHGEDIRVAYISSSIYRKQAIDSQKAHLLLYNQALLYWFHKVITPITGSNLIQEKVEIPDVKEDYFSRCLENHLPHSDDINLIIWELPELRKKSGGKLAPAIGKFTETVLKSALNFASHPEIIMVDFYRGRGLSKSDYCSQLNQDVELKLAGRYDNTLLSWSKSICPYLKDDEEGFSYSYLFSGDKDHPSIIGHAQMAYILADFLRDEFLRFLSEHSTKNMKYKDFKIKTPEIPSKSLFAKIERPLCYTSLRSLGNTQDASNVPLELRFIKPKDKSTAESAENANARSSISPSLGNKKVHSVMLRFTIPGHVNVTQSTTLGILPYVSKPALTVARVDNQPFFKLNVSKITRGQILELQPTTLLTGGDHLIRFYSLDKRFNVLAFTVDEKKKGAD